MYSHPPLPVIIARRAAEQPDDTAIVSLSTDEELTWRDVDRECRRWASALKRLSVEAGEYVVTLMPNLPEAMFAWLGTAWLRAIEVPVNTEYRGEWLTHAVNTSHARIIVTSRRFTSTLALVADALEHVHIVLVYDAKPGDDDHGLSSRFHVVTGEEIFAGVEPAEGLPEPQPWDLMSVIYTSGTTGQAKPVLLPWGMQEAQALLFSPPEFRDSTFYGFWPPFHMLGKSQIFVPAVFGGKLVMRERFSIGEFWEDIRTHGCTAAYVVSVIASFLQSLPPSEDDADNPLKAVVMGPVIPEVDEFKRRFGIEKVYTTFGSTEVGIAFYSFMRDVTSTNWQSCGRILPEAPHEVRLVDEHDLPVGPGVPAELVVRPKVPWTMNTGYLNMPEATVKAWRNGWYHTGDTFIYDEQGEYHFLDRSKDYIRRRGENISSFEVEQAVCSHPDVAQAAAVAVPSESGEDEVMVFLVPAPGVSIDIAGLIAHLADRVPKFAMPRFFEVLDGFPTTQATFRTQKVVLRDRGRGEQTFDRLQLEPAT